MYISVLIKDLLKKNLVLFVDNGIQKQKCENENDIKYTKVK